MLVLTRGPGQLILLQRDGTQIEVEVLEVHGDRVRVGIRAPGHVKVLRKELVLDGHDGDGAAGRLNA